MATTNLASAGPAAGIATTGVANGALAASGAAKVADLTPVSELDQSGTAITDRRRPICSVARSPRQPTPERELSDRSNAVVSGGYCNSYTFPISTFCTNADGNAAHLPR